MPARNRPSWCAASPPRRRSMWWRVLASAGAGAGRARRQAGRRGAACAAEFFRRRARRPHGAGAIAARCAPLQHRAAGRRAMPRRSSPAMRQDLHPGTHAAGAADRATGSTRTLESNWFILPGLVCVLSMIMAMLISALSLARERELGTFEQLLVTPLRPVEILVGKALPGIIVGLIDANIVIAGGAAVVPRCRFAATCCCWKRCCCSTCWRASASACAISSLARTQQQAMLGVFVIASPDDRAVRLCRAGREHAADGRVASAAAIRCATCW